MNMRHLTRIIESTPTSDGAGVKLRRSLGSQRGLYVDPFLMLDEFYSTIRMIISPVSRLIRIAVLRRSPTCSTDTCATRTISATAATWVPAMSSG